MNHHKERFCSENIHNSSKHLLLGILPSVCLVLVFSSFLQFQQHYTPLTDTRWSQDTELCKSRVSVNHRKAKSSVFVLKPEMPALLVFAEYYSICVNSRSVTKIT